MPQETKPTRQAVRRSLGWATRATISIAIPLACGLLLASTGLPRRVYNHAGRFWEITGLYDSTPVKVLARREHQARPPLSKTLRYITEGAIYATMIVPSFVLAIFIYDRLTFRYSRERLIRCLQCGHILQGLSEPRCPECGEPI